MVIFHSYVSLPGNIFLWCQPSRIWPEIESSHHSIASPNQFTKAKSINPGIPRSLGGKTHSNKKCHLPYQISIISQCVISQLYVLRFTMFYHVTPINPIHVIPVVSQYHPATTRVLRIHGVAGNFSCHAEYQGLDLCHADAGGLGLTQHWMWKRRHPPVILKMDDCRWIYHTSLWWWYTMVYLNYSC